ncbi:hypothetical protein AK812_SmicGene21653 [Symbiodinium microadriaticum]|uniref:Uncharacterized protein n=1 Tax=Symbiodinium microadriaticum TaxID=2951 RepID=A0A1Q9DLU3_SYMMI|nr:hypothetical protein AK812_SmicGene21653 [Symbiodinium microadriaticum]
MSSSIWAAQPAKASTRSFSATEPRVEEETGTGLLNYHDMASATDSDTVVATASAADTEDASEKEGAFPVHTLEGDYWGRFLENVPRNLRESFEAESGGGSRGADPQDPKSRKEEETDLAALGVYAEGVEVVPKTPSPITSMRFTPYNYEYPPMRLENKYNTKISTRLSVILRHDKGKFNLRFYPNAAAELREILKLTKNEESFWVFVRLMDHEDFGLGGFYVGRRRPYPKGPKDPIIRSASGTDIRQPSRM